MPKWLIDSPTRGTLNVHPSLLPLLRGASPIRSTILGDMRQQCGVSIMQMDEKMDHGPIVAQQIMDIEEAQWPIHGNELDIALANIGGALLASIIPQWMAGDIDPQEQDHDQATFCGKLDRSSGELELDPCNLPTGKEAYQTLLKIRAFEGYPGTFFIYENKRVKVIDAVLSESGTLEINQVVPEGKKQIAFQLYLDGLAR